MGFLVSALESGVPGAGSEVGLPLATPSQNQYISPSPFRFFLFKLTFPDREKMNALVDSVNAKIQSVCSTTAQCVYVDPQPDVDALQGHFCEPGVDETYRWFKGGASKDR